MFNLTPTVRILLFLNIGVFILQSQIPAVNMMALYPIGSSHFQPWQFVSYMFMHGGWGHILSNMFGLISFGPLLEQRWGGNRFLTFWMICGIGAGVLYSGVRHYEISRMRQDIETFRQEPTDVNLQDFVDRSLPDYKGAYEPVVQQLHKTPDDPQLIQGALNSMEQLLAAGLNSPMLGASGALFGLLFAFAYLFPNTELMLLFFPFPIKAKYFVGLYALYELYNGVHRTPGDNVAHFAHLGGLLIGFIVLKFWERGRTRFY
ncbi:rhomboid family intramembrane serine protease [Hymenobacter cellulosivorans]|uniref:Rhomboid family intramembrane serine protease n=1 Tax=Hymenobacter cellulosivorans TaxID=2932249 RepID=A0ABY4FEW9_9BACT|nr:rhomboid family intramembrane serine protease [Hymenobacter cellulosivorans]UOQ55222.1 rhomboid family intramembrane serine protease [Hymenobacter cellulosivorans]